MKLNDQKGSTLGTLISLKQGGQLYSDRKKKGDILADPGVKLYAADVPA